MINRRGFLAALAAVVVTPVATRSYEQSRTIRYGMMSPTGRLQWTPLGRCVIYAGEDLPKHRLVTPDGMLVRKATDRIAGVTEQDIPMLTHGWVRTHGPALVEADFSETELRIFRHYTRADWKEFRLPDGRKGMRLGG